MSILSSLRKSINPVTPSRNVLNARPIKSTPGAAFAILSSFWTGSESKNLVNALAIPASSPPADNAINPTAIAARAGPASARFLNGTFARALNIFANFCIGPSAIFAAAANGMSAVPIAPIAKAPASNKGDIAPARAARAPNPITVVIPIATAFHFTLENPFIALENIHTDAAIPAIASTPNSAFG